MWSFPNPSALGAAAVGCCWSWSADLGLRFGPFAGMEDRERAQKQWGLSPECLQDRSGQGCFLLKAVEKASVPRCPPDLSSAWLWPGALALPWLPLQVLLALSL